MNKSILIGLIVVVILGAGGFVVFHKSSDKTTDKSATTATTSSAPNASASSSASPAPAAASTSDSSSSAPSNPLSVTVVANDDSATPETITTSKGRTVHLTFNVSTNGTYHGGLDFKNSALGLDSGSIAEGSSKTMTFTATKSFKFTPYWYQSDVQKDYFVTVNVK